MSASRHCDVATGSVDLYGRTVGAPDLPSLSLGRRVLPSLAEARHWGADT